MGVSIEKVFHREAIFKDSRPASGWLWCLHCQRAYKWGEYREVQLVRGGFTFQMCPYDDCDGDTVLDGVPWEAIRSNHSDYPEIPTRGQTYLLY